MSRMRSICQIALLPLFLLLACCFMPLQAQVTTATVIGTVTDTTGAVVPDAVVSLKNINNNVVRQMKSGNDGSFNFQFVVVGRYELTVSRGGFKTQTLTGLELNTSQALNLPVHLSVADAVQSVQVTSSDTGLIQTVTSDQESTLPSLALNTLPVKHQDWTSMLALSTATIKPVSTSTAGSTSPQGSGLNVNGLASVGYNLTVDGTNATSNPEFTAFNFYQGPNVVNTVNNDAIAEVGFTKGIAPATVGNTLSSNINLVTKSGTNKYHGSLYEINEVALYDARNQFLKRMPGKTFNEYGGSIGGPIMKDKLFLFGSYTGARLFSQSPVAGTVPTPYLTTNACGCSNPIYDQLFKLLPSIPQPSNNPTALAGTYFGAGTQQVKDGNGVARLDYYLNPRNQIAVRYIRSRPFNSTPSYIKSNPQVYTGHMDAINANYTHIGDRWTENTRFGFNQLMLNRINNGYFENLPGLAYAGFSTQGANEFLQHGNVTDYEESVVYVRGKHAIQFGGIMEKTFAARFKFGTAYLAYSTAANFEANTPDGIYDPVYTLPTNTPLFGWTTWNYGGYVQDDYHVTNSLTLNIGMRYDYFTIPKEARGRVFNRGIDPAHASLGWGFGPFLPSDSMYQPTYANVQPRIGFAWVPPFDSKTVVRGGFGRFAINHTIYGGPVDTFGLPGGLPLAFGVDHDQALAIGLNYPVDGSFDTFMSDIKQLQQAGVVGTNLPFENISAYFPDPASMQIFLGVERELPGGFAAKIHYIGTRGLHLNQFLARNLPDRVTGIAPLPGFGSFNQFMAGDSSNFNGLETELSKRLMNGVQVDANYTWSKTLSTGDADLLQPTMVQDNNNPKGDYGPAPFDIRQRFVIDGMWNLPLNMLAHNYASRLLLGGWVLGGIFTGQTGLPINVMNSSSSYPADRPNWGSGPRYVSGYRTFGAGHVHQYLNPCRPTGACVNAPSYAGNAAFVPVPLGPKNAQITPGTLHRYDLYAPGYEDLDLSVKKIFQFSEKANFQLRMDAFNALNHTNLSGIIQSISSANFGQLTSATSRSVQIGGRIEF